MSSTDNRIVQMQFDNKQFESGVKQTMNSLDKLEDSLQLNGATRGMEKVSTESKELCKSMNQMDSAIETVKIQFSALQIAGVVAMTKLTLAAINVGKKINSAIFGQVVSGGARRSQNIEQAKFQLEGLGVAWDDIKGDIDYGVKDTAYGLDAAAKAASQLVASEVQVGDEMKTALRGISGVAAMTSREYDEVAHIFTTIAGNGRVMGMQLTQLSTYGLNAAAKLAEYYREVKGVSDATEQSIRDLVSKGKIGFKEFADAMDWAFGEHAKEANKTFTGALSNTKAALSRIGQKFADPIYENLRKSLNGIIPAINAVNSSLTPVYEIVETFTNVIGDFIVQLVESEDFLDGLKNICMALWSYLRPIKYALQELGILSSTNAEGVAAVFKELTSHLELSGKKVMFVKDAIKAIINVFRILSFTVVGVINAISPIFTGLADAMGLVWKRSDNIFDLINDNYSVIIRTIASVSDFIRLNLADYIGRAIKIAKTINWGNLIVSIMSITKLMSYALEIIGFIANIASTVIGYLMDNLPNVRNILSDIVGLMIAGGAAIGGFFSNLFNTDSQIDIQADINSGSFDNASSSVSKVEETFDEMTDKTGTVVKNLNTVAETAEETGKRTDRAMKGAAQSYEDAADQAEELREKLKEVREEENRRHADQKKHLEDGAGSIFLPREEAKDIRKKTFGGSDISAKEETHAINKFFERILDALNVGDYDIRHAFYKTGDVLWAGYGYLKSGIIKIFTFLSDLIDALSKPFGIIGFAMKYSQVIGSVMAGLFVIFNVKIIGTLLSILDIIPTIVNALKSVYIANLAKAIGDFLLKFAVFTLALGAFMIAVAYATRIVDMDVLKEFYEMLHGTILWLRFVGQELIALAAVFSLSNVMRGIALMEGNGKAFTISLASISETIVGIGLIFASFLGTMAFIAYLGDDAIPIIEKTGKLFGIFMGIIALFITWVLILTKLTDISGTVTTANKGFLKAFNFTRTISPLAEVSSIILSIIPLMLATALAFYMVKDINSAQLVNSGLAFGAVLLSIGLLLTFLETAATFIDPTAIYYLSKITPVILSLSILIVSIGAAIWIINQVSIQQTDIWGNVIGPLLAVLTTLAFFYMGIVGLSALFASGQSGQLQSLIVQMAILMVSIGALVTMIAGSMWIIDQVKDIQGALSTFIASLGIVLLFIIFTEVVMLAIQAVSKTAGLASLDMVQLAVLFISLGTLLLMMSMAASIASNVEWHGFWVLAAEATLIVLFIGAVEAIVGKLGGLGKNPFNIVQIVVLLSMITVMFTALAVVALILQSVDWHAMIAATPYILGATVFVSAIMALCALLAATVNNVGQILTIIATLGLVIILMYALAHLFEVLGDIDWNTMENAKPILLGVGIFFGAMMVVFTTLAIVGAACPPVLAAITAIAAVIFGIAAVIGTIALVIVSIGATALMIAYAISSIAESFQKFSEVDFDVVEDAIDSIADFMGTIADLSLKMPLALIGLGLMSVGLYLTAQALTIMSLITPSMVETAMAGLELLLEKLKELFSGDNSAVIAEAMIIATGLALIAMLIGVGIATLAAGIFAGSVLLLLSAVVWNLAGEFIFNGMVAFVDNMAALAPILMGSFKEMIISLGLLAILGVLLTVGGAAIMAGGLVLTIASLLLLAGSALLSASVDLLTKALDPKVIKNIMLGSVMMMGFCLELVLVGTMLSVSSIALMAGAAMFIGGAKLLEIGTGIFEDAVDHIKDASEDLVEIANNMQEAGHNIVAGLVEGINEDAPLVEEAMTALGSTTILGTLFTVLDMHSPSEELRKAGHNIIAGLVEGIEDKHPILAQTIADIANSIPPIFGNSGTESGNSFGDGISDALDAIKSPISEKMSSLGSLWGADMGNAFGEQMTGAFNGVGSMLDQMAAKVQEAYAPYAHMYDMQSDTSPNSQYAFENLPGSVQEYIKNAEAATIIASGGEYQLPTEEEWEDWKWEKLYGGDYPTGPVGTPPTEDLTEGLTGGKSSSDLADSIASNSGAGTGINDISQGGTNINSNNTYNFTQNNYSPKELDRTELYEQTNYQLKRWYGWMQSNV